MSNLATGSLALIKKDTVDIVAAKVRQFQEKGELHLPPNYSAENAMKAAWLILQETVDKDKKPALQVCTRDSIANSLLDMVVQGLNPAKKQGYFIVYGNKLVFQRSYFGTMAVTKQVANAQDIVAQVVYKGDEFLYEIKSGRKYIIKHIQKIENINHENIIAAYCTILFKDGSEYTDIMTFDQIKKAWSKSKMSPEKDGSTHKEFPEEMAKKTVINRTCKKYINSSNDSNLFLHHFNRSDEEITEAEVAQEIEENANSEPIDVDYAVTEEAPRLEDKIEPAPAPATRNQPTQKNSAEQPGLFGKTGTEGPGF